MILIADKSNKNYMDEIKEVIGDKLNIDEDIIKLFFAIEKDKDGKGTVTGKTEIGYIIDTCDALGFDAYSIYLVLCGKIDISFVRMLEMKDILDEELINMPTVNDKKLKQKKKNKSEGNVIQLNRKNTKNSPTS